ncbi:unnamed protein product [Rotaria socialis]|uniref:J domain-containing protein n=1 Tax=Rotaria socialis TaxID=392032 RepID=A0A820CVY5_9BILA|nr:unnamed protein product [Rotaria socialis]CAF4214535.1 unnamed protein product [Rotaria socialis]
METTNRTPYQVLCIHETDVDKNLTNIFRQKILEFKQDQLQPAGQQTISIETFRLVCRAYETLSNPDKRKRYEQTKKWEFHIPVEHYTLQQIVAEPNLFSLLENRCQNATLREINSQHPETGQTPLYCAARAGNVKAVRYLTECGADPDLKQRSKSTALHVASFYGHPDVVLCLLESGANYCQRNAYGNLAEDEALNSAVRNSFTELKKDPYVQAAADQLDWFKINAENLPHPDYQYHTLSQTLLHCASKKGHKDLVKWLVAKKKCNLDVVDINLNSALHLAAHAKSRSIIKYLLDNGANPSLTNRWGMTAEQEGSIQGESVKRIFESIRNEDMFKMAAEGVDWWFQYHFGDKSPDATNTAGVTILYVACRYGKTAVAQWLLEHGANINMRIRDGSLSTSLHGAVYHGHISTVELLLNYGADVNLRNKYGATVFEEARSDDMKKLLQQYRQNMKENRFISVHLFGDGTSYGNEPLVKLQLPCNATFAELIESMPERLRKIYTHFSMARRPLNINTDYIPVVSTVCRARYGKTKFIELPLCVTAHESARYTHSGHVMGPELPYLSVREFHKKFDEISETAKIKIRPIKDESQTIKIKNLSFIFPPECVENSVTLYVNYIFPPDFQSFYLEGCIGMFKTRYSNHENRLNKMPTVTFTGETTAQLYTWTQSSAYWFTSNSRDTSLPLIDGVHAFIKTIEIIPSLLSLPGDMFLQNTLGKPLISRQDPVPCRCLKIREHNARVFPHIAYHGTKIQVIRSILMDGFVMPSTVVSSGLRVIPPSNHIARGISAFGVADFCNAIFISPSIHYCSDPCYAVTFTYDDECLFPVIECAVKSESYRAFPSTVKSYTAKANDEIEKIEWRLQNPADIEILSILFIPMVKSRSKAARSRAKKLGVDPNRISSKP